MPSTPGPKSRSPLTLEAFFKKRFRLLVSFGALVVLILYGYMLLRAHDHMVSVQSATGGELKEIKVLMDAMDKESSQMASLVSELEGQRDSLPLVVAGDLKPAVVRVGLPPSSALPPPPPPPPSSSSPPLPSTLTQQSPKVSLGSEKVIPEPITFNSPHSASAESVLVVCGTDGSGTRRVVDVLTELGVRMVSEDPETFDIHADIMGGWPPIVKPLLRQTRSLSYDPAQLAQSQPGLHRQLSAALDKLVRQASADSHKPTSYKLAVGGLLPRADRFAASGVKFGFKAPVAITLAPYWSHIIPHFKLLHVVRDGRDIAFSANQGPVEKFYMDMYPPGIQQRGIQGPLSPPLMAVRLWSDWNSQVLEWARGRAQSLETATASAASAATAATATSGSSSFGYLALHVEDLVSPSITQRFAAIASLAKWVSSNATLPQLCCLALEDAEYLGSHDRVERQEVRNAHQHVSSKYGKWRGLVQRDSVLAKGLNSLGANGLRVLGYEPPRSLAEEGAALQLTPKVDRAGLGVGKGFVCTRERHKRGEIICPRQEKPLPYNYLEYAGPGCSSVSGTDYKGDGSSDIEIVEVSDAAPKLGSTPESIKNDWCCRLCQRHPQCRAFTVDVMNRVCFLKRRKGVVVQNERTTLFVSGDITRK